MAHQESFAGPLPRGSYPPPRRFVGAAGRIIYGAALVPIGVLLVYFLIVLFPLTVHATNTSAGGSFDYLGIQITVSGEEALLLVVVATSALGSYIHVCISFATYVGNRMLVSSWLWWYPMRILSSIPLALIFYFGVRGGLLSTGAGVGDINPYGIAGLAGLVGLFSDAAISKLREAFGASDPETIFRAAPYVDNHSQTVEPDSIIEPPTDQERDAT